MSKKYKENQMEKLNEYAREYLNISNEKIDYQKITGQMREFSYADYVMLNIFDDNGKEFTIVGFNGKKDKIKKVIDITGFDLVGKKLKYLKGTHEKFEKSIVTRIKNLKDMVGSAFSDRAIFLIEKIFDIKDLLVVRIVKGEKTIGNFTLFFSESESEIDYKMLELFSSQVGLYIDKKTNEENLIKTKNSLENIIKGTNVGTWELDVKTGKSIINKRWAQMIGYKVKDILPASEEKREELIHPEDLPKLQRKYKKALNREIEDYNIELRKKHKNGKWIWVNARAKVTKWSEDGEPLIVSGALIDINEKKKNEQKIIKAKERLENIIEATNVGTWQRNLKTGEAEIDRKWAEILGYKLEELLPMDTKSWIELIHKDDVRKTENEIYKLINRENEYYNVEYRIKHKNGKWIWVNGRGKITKWSKNSEPVLISGTTMDITEKKKMEIEIDENRNKLRNILETTQDGFWIVDENQRFIDVNDAYCEMSGYKREEFLNLKIPDLEFYENEKEADDRIKKILKIGYDIFETKHVKKNGEVFDVEASASCLSKEPVEIVSFCRDITEKKKMNLKTIEMKERLENLANQAPGVLYKYQLFPDGSSRFPYSSNGIYDIYEVIPEDVVKDASIFFKRIHPDDYERVVDSIKISAEKLEIWDEQYRVILPKKGEKWVHGKSKPKKVADGSIIWYGNIREITREKKLQLKIKDQKDRFKNVIEGTNAGTWEHDIKEDKEIVNEKWARILGYKLKEISPVEMKKLKEMTHPDDLKKVEREFERLINEEIEYYDIEFRMKNKNGKWIWINSKGKISKRSEEGKPLLISGTTINITEKKDKERKIEYLSFHDSLTGLYNRRFMEDSIERLDTDRNIPFSIIVADINGLKLTNDAYGHRMGDKLLIATSEILKKSCRKEDIISRVGGDEFVILLPNTDEKTTKEIMKRIKKESENYKLDSVIISIATGCSTKHKEDEDISMIYKEADNSMYKDKIKIGRIMRSKTIETLLLNINNKYDNEQIHTERTAQYCESIAKAMKLNEKDIRDAKIAGVLHDVGKIVVDPDILNKKEKLADKELEEIKRHPTISYQLLKNVDEYSHLAEAVLYHHERIDGTGYPEGLKEGEIPLLSKIISVADAYEAMTANRPYKKTKTKEEAIEELKKYSGSQFDKKIVDVFINEVL